MTEPSSLDLAAPAPAQSAPVSTVSPAPVTIPATAEEASLTLTPPAPVAVVQPQQAGGMVPLDPAKAEAVRQRAAAYAETLSGLDANSPELAKKVDEISGMGNNEIRATSQVSSNLLNRPVTALAASKGEGGGSQEIVAKGLVDLRRTCQDLDPSQVNATGAKGFLAHLPFMNRAKDYFAKYQSAQSHINAIIKALENGRTSLLKDNADIERERAQMWQSMQQLQEYIVLAEALDQAVSAKVAELEGTDPEKAKALKSDVLFAVRQKHQDLLTQMAVAAQGYLALDLVKKNNVELIKGVERATTTTVAALRTAVIVAQALANQKLVLDQIEALNTTTSNMIQATAAMLEQQSVQIQQQASTSTVSIEALTAAFQSVYNTMDAIDNFKAQAVESMAQTVTSLEGQIAKSQPYLERSHKDAQK